MKNLVIAFALACSVMVAQGGCLSPRPSVAPPVLTVATAPLVVEVFVGDPVLDSKVVGAEVSIAGRVVTTDGAGNAHLELPMAPYDVSVNAKGYKPWTGEVNLASTSSLQVSLESDRPVFMRGPLSVRGRALVYPDGSRFLWRGVTAFALNEQVSSGRREEAERFMAWARNTGFNVVRILVMLPKGWMVDGDFTPAEGLAALPMTLALAREQDLYVHVTVLANTEALPNDDLGSYVERAGRICVDAGNCALVEVANEPYHPTQRSDVHDAATLARWAARVPHMIPTALGAAANDESDEMAKSSVVTAHLDRGRDPWNMVRRVRELELLSAKTGKPVLNGEPDGFGESAVETRPNGTTYRRQTDPSLAFAFGALARVFEVGTTYHFEDGLLAQIPRPNQLVCAHAFIAGTSIAPDDDVLTFQNAGWHTSPVAKVRLADGEPRQNTTVRAYSGVGTHTVLVLVGVEGDAGVELRDPWTRSGVIAERPRISVWGLTR